MNSKSSLTFNADCLRLYLVTDSGLTRGRALVDVVLAAIRGGVTCVQLREKQLTTRDFMALAVQLKALLEPLRVPLVINDRVDIALACGADGVHLGQSDMPVSEARLMLSPQTFIGLSVESMADLDESADLAADYLGISPVFSTPTKTDTNSPWGLDGLRQIRARTGRPLVAIGGINETNAHEVMQAGADGIAVVSALCMAEDPCIAAQRLHKLCCGVH